MYIGLDEFQTGPSLSDEEFNNRQEKYPLIFYACYHWGHHLKRHEDGSIENLALDFLYNNSLRESVSQIIGTVGSYRNFSQNYPKGVTGIHMAALFGLNQLLDTLLHSADVALEAKDSRGQTALHYACTKGHEIIVNQLLEAGAILEQGDNFNLTPLHHAIESGHQAIVETLLDANAYIGPINGLSALHLASRHGQSYLIDLLLERGAGIDCPTNFQSTPLHLAIMNGHEYCASLLLTRGANPKAVDQSRYTPLHYATLGNLRNVMQELLDHGAEIDARQDKLWTALHLASLSDQSSTIQLLISNKATIDAVCRLGRTPLHYSTLHRRIEAVQILLNNKASLSVKDHSGHTPLDLACTQSSLRMMISIVDGMNNDLNVSKDSVLHKLALSGASADDIDVFLSKGEVDVNIKGLSDGTPLHRAAAEGRAETVRAFLERGANTNSLTLRGFSPLAFAIINNQVSVILVLIASNQVNIEAMSSGDSMLHVAIRRCSTQVIALLIEAGADCCSRSYWGELPLHCATRYGRVDAVKLLLDKDPEVDVNDRNNEGETPIFLAAEMGVYELVELLLDVGADPSVPNMNGLRPRQVAEIGRYRDIATLLS